MNGECDVAAHYSRPGLLARLHAALRADGVDPAHPTIDTLAPYDQFHGRGLEATEEMARQIAVVPGPARYFANRFGCRVTGIDLTPEFCEVAGTLARMLRLDDRVKFELGDALAMPFADATFTGAYSMNVSMNIADKAGFYREIHRVLCPGAWLVLSEIAQGEGPGPDYPTPWASGAHTSFLSTPEQTQRGLLEAGFDVDRLHSTAEQARAFGARSRALVERGEKPPHRAVMLMHGELAAQAMANTARALLEGRIVPIEVLCRKRG